MEIQTWQLIVGVVIVAFGFIFLLMERRRIQKESLTKGDEIIDLEERLGTRQSNSYRIGLNKALGGIHELIGKFAYFTKVEDWWFLSGSSTAPPIDMIAIKDGSLKIIEFKKNGASLSTSENKIRRMIQEKKVEYEVLDVEIPDGVTISKRQLPKSRIVRAENSRNNSKKIIANEFEKLKKNV